MDKDLEDEKSLYGATAPSEEGIVPGRVPVAVANTSERTSESHSGATWPIGRDSWRGEVAI